MRYFIVFSYDGTKFHGFQRQKNVLNVQSTIESILTNHFGEEITIKGAGRTDAGVHAKGQTATFDISKKITFKDKNTLKKELINNNIIIKKIKKVDNNFHARFSAKGKWYRYQINIGDYNDNYCGYYYQPKFKVDFSKLKQSKNTFLGTHDFRNFISGKRDNYETCITKINIKRKNNILIIDFYGYGFYRYMIRNLVGALLDVGKGKITNEVLKDMLDNPQVEKHLSVAPADGLYLMKVYY